MAAVHSETVCVSRLIHLYFSSFGKATLKKCGQEHAVQCTVDENRNTLTVTGSSDGIESFLNIFQKLFYSESVAVERQTLEHLNWEEKLKQITDSMYCSWSLEDQLNGRCKKIVEWRYPYRNKCLTLVEGDALQCNAKHVIVLTNTAGCPLVKLNTSLCM